MSTIAQHNSFAPSPDVVTSIVLPTIIFCIGMVVAMLIGINRCKQWELDKIGEIRRTRRVIQRITARLREKNFRTIQKARNMRKRAVHPNVAEKVVDSKAKQSADAFVSDPSVFPPPPCYSNLRFPSGTSPPPTYEDSLLDELYRECLPPLEQPQILNRVSSQRPVNCANSSQMPGTSKSFKRNR